MRTRYGVFGVLIGVAVSAVVLAQAWFWENGAVMAEEDVHPIAWWTFADEGDVLFDSVGEFDVELLGSSIVRIPLDVIGFALQVNTDGAGGEIVDIANFTELPFDGEGGFTITAWIRSDMAAEGVPPLLAPSPYPLAPLFPEGEWFHLALAHNNYDVTSVYINGTLADATFDGDVPQWLAEAVALGFEGISWHGAIADVRVFDSTLSPDEVEGAFIEAEEFVLSLENDEATSGTAAISAFRALLGNDGRRAFERAGTEEDGPGRGGILRPGAIPVPANSLFQILTPMEK